MKKFLKVITIILTVIVVFLLGVRGYFRLSVSSYYKECDKGFIIPESNKGFIAQGISYDEKSNYFFVTGYMKESGKASPIYLIKDGMKKCDKKVNLLDKEGNAFDSHCGGLAVTDKYVYVANEASICVFSYNDIINAENNSDVKSIGSFSTKKSEEDYLGVAFLTINEGYLYVGEFYREQNFKTLDSHKFTTPSGDNNTALLLGYKLIDNADTFNIDSKPSIAYSMRGLVQGACFYNGKIYLSTSYAVAFSNIYCYDLSKCTKMDDINVLGGDCPLYALDSNNLVDTIKIAPMSEEIEIVDGKMYIMNESASNKYIFGKFTSGYWCYKYNLE